MTIGEKIVKLRKQAGYSQEVFSEKLGLSRQAVSKWENGSAQPTSDNLAQIAKLFDVPLSALLDDEDVSIGQPAPHQDVQKTEKSTSKNKIDLLQNIAVIILGIAVIMQGFTIGGLRQDISGTKSQINEITYLRNELNSLRSYIYSMPEGYLTSNENFTDYHYEITDYNYETDTATLSFSVVPTDYTRNTQAKIVIKGARDSYSADAVMENDIFTAQLDVKCEDNLSVYLYLTDNGNTRSFILDYLSNPNSNYVITVENVTAEIMPAVAEQKNGMVLLDTVLACDFSFLQDNLPAKAVIQLWAVNENYSTGIFIAEFPFEAIMEYGNNDEYEAYEVNETVPSGAGSTVTCFQNIYMEIRHEEITEDSRFYFKVLLVNDDGMEYSGESEFIN